MTSFLICLRNRIWNQFLFIYYLQIRYNFYFGIAESYFFKRIAYNVPLTVKIVQELETMFDTDLRIKWLSVSCEPRIGHSSPHMETRPRLAEIIGLETVRHLLHYTSLVIYDDHIGFSLVSESYPIRKHLYFHNP